ncbi:hypothetical protein LV476_09820 [Guyparkeria hydrothermalis]|uniref:hypothetical protein n=1 Tax=Guyparkeria hydrothermalis TaxID=923 RepID=UPI0020204720|nr:hypothetical protein [Guyparkeria hydrothermalis]MCL7745233.1 hypothetical protein [Guyparkeria hydrothermalis]
MERASQGFRECLRVDLRLLSAWMGLMLAAWLAASWVVWSGPWPIGAPQPWQETVWRLVAWVVVSVWVVRGLQHRPQGFALEGRLVWSGGHGEVVSANGETVRGPARLQWQSPLLVGVTIDDPASGPLTLWLTPWRLGERGWWRLQRFLMLARH